MVGDEVRERRRRLATIGACLGEFGGDLIARIARPALGGVESNDTDWGEILSLEQMADQRGAVGIGHVGLGPGQAAELAGEVIKHESSLANPTDSQPLRATVGSN